MKYSGMADVRQILQYLYAERDRLARVIQSMEEFQSALLDERPMPPRRRGRKSMSAEERAQVSTRMRNYWARRSLAG